MTILKMKTWTFWRMCFFFLDEGQPDENSDGIDSDNLEEEVDEKELTGLQMKQKSSNLMLFMPRPRLWQ